MMLLEQKQPLKLAVIGEASEEIFESSKIGYRTTICNRYSGVARLAKELKSLKWETQINVK
jgi:hypothetical protein